MKRRGALLLACALVPAGPAAAMAPCQLGTRPAVLAVMRFGLLMPSGAEVIEAQWTQFRSDVLDPVLRTAITQRDEPPSVGPPPRRIRVAAIEVPVSFNPNAPPALPASVRSVMHAWTARFPQASVDAAMWPVCLAV